MIERKKETINPRYENNSHAYTNKITEPNENTKSKIIRHDLDHNPDLELFVIDEGIKRILATTIFICLIIFLLNTWGF